METAREVERICCCQLQRRDGRHDPQVRGIEGQLMRTVIIRRVPMFGADVGEDREEPFPCDISTSGGTGGAIRRIAENMHPKCELVCDTVPNKMIVCNREGRPDGRPFPFCMPKWGGGCGLSQMYMGADTPTPRRIGDRLRKYTVRT